MLAGYPPFACASRHECAYFKEYDDSNELCFPHTFSWRAIRLLCRMLHLDASKRISLADALGFAEAWASDVSADAADSPGVDHGRLRRAALDAPPLPLAEKAVEPPSAERGRVEVGGGRKRAMDDAFNEPLLVLR
eukprot:6666622-Prymnesium_polylepis.1